MELAVLSLHLVVSVCLIGLVLLQRSEGGALGMGGGGSGSLMSGRGAADALARMTSIAGGFFLVTSLSLTVISGASASRGPSPLDLFPSQQQQPATQSPEELPPAPLDPTESSAPQATETELAALSAAPAPNVVGAPVAPPATQATERAGPLASNNQPASARAPATQQRPANPPVQRPAAPQTQPAATPPAQRSNPTQQAARPPAQRPAAQTVAATQRPAAQPAARPPALILPNSSGAGLAEPAPTAPESVDVGGGLEAVRRERAGPDQ